MQASEDAVGAVVVVVVVTVVDGSAAEFSAASAADAGHAVGEVFRGNCLSTEPAHRLGPSAPHPEIDFSRMIH